jgi:DNA mismatch repair protein MutL
MFDLSNAMAKANATTPITTATDRASAAQTRRPELTSSREPSVAAAPNTLFDDDERPPVSDAPTAASSDRGAPNAVRAAGSVDVVTTLVSADPRANEILDAVAREQAAHARGHYGALKLLAQVRNTFLVCEGPDGILVIDQHAAAERVNFDRLRKQAQSRSVERQQLLVPETVDLTSVEAALVDDARDEILALGLDARRIGDTRAAIHGVPALLKRGRPAQLLRDLVDELGRTGSRRFGDAIDLVLATLACHGSVRAGDPLHVSECVALLQALDGVDFARHCPHGRPILAALSYGELEKKVGRR